MRTIQAVKIGLLVTFLSATGMALAQESSVPSGSGGWRRLGSAPAGEPAQSPQGPQGPARSYEPGTPPPPAQLTIERGTFLTIRLNQVLSSDRSQQGDPFSATLVKPVVVDGIIVADRGQTIAGRVSEATKAGRAKGVSHLGLELTDMTLVDGHQVPLHTQLVGRNGSTSVGRDATAIGTTTAIGAMIGAAAGWGTGAAIGAGAGAAAGTIGVLLTRGNPTVVYPEQVLTFRLEEPIVVSTDRAPLAFRPVGPGDYDQPQDQPRLLARPPTPPPAPYYGPVWGPYYGPYPYYYGPGITLGFGFGGYYGRGYYGGRYYGRGHYGGRGYGGHYRR
jgi:hypothetical protein